MDLYLDCLPDELIIIIMKYLREKSCELSKLNNYYLKLYNEFINNINRRSFPWKTARWRSLIAKWIDISR
jgi:hypothetical protein